MALSTALLDFSAVQPMFTDAERAKVQAFWAEPGRLTSVAADRTHPYQPVMTGEGSAWILNYYHVRSPGSRVVPTRDPRPQNSDQTRWDAWITKKYEVDREAAQLECDRLNGLPVGQAKLTVGPMPDDLLKLAGTPPSFVQAKLVRAHVVKFPDFSALLKEGVEVRRKYPFYRFPQGVDVHSGPLSSRDLNKLFAGAGITPKTGRVLMAVAALEGGFGSVNTYDTGYVSVGFVQFASLHDGGGSLGEMMRRYKRANPKAFERDFRRYGVDVTENGYLVVLDPASGVQYAGPKANDKIIEDKRLTAVFNRAGAVSNDFRVAQVRAAIDRFYPGNVSFTAYINGESVSGRLSDVFKSEAGLATLMDRYVNTGNLGPVGSTVEGVMRKYGYTSLDQAAQSERELIEALRYRRDFTQVASLSQPSSAPVATLGSAPDSIEELVDFVKDANPVVPAAAKPEPKPEPKAEPKPEAKPEPKPELKPETKPDTSHDPGKNKLPDTPVEKKPVEEKKELPPPEKKGEPEKTKGGG